jgi:hypothetical protein
MISLEIAAKAARCENRANSSSEKGLVGLHRLVAENGPGSVDMAIGALEEGASWAAVRGAWGSDPCPVVDHLASLIASFKLKRADERKEGTTFSTSAATTTTTTSSTTTTMMMMVSPESALEKTSETGHDRKRQRVEDEGKGGVGLGTWLAVVRGWLAGCTEAQRCVERALELAAASPRVEELASVALEQALRPRTALDRGLADRVSFLVRLSPSSAVAYVVSRSGGALGPATTRLLLSVLFEPDTLRKLGELQQGRGALTAVVQGILAGAAGLAGAIAGGPASRDPSQAAAPVDLEVVRMLREAARPSSPHLSLFAGLPLHLPLAVLGRCLSEWRGSGPLARELTALSVDLARCCCGAEAGPEVLRWFWHAAVSNCPDAAALAYLEALAELILVVDGGPGGVRDAEVATLSEVILRDFPAPDDAQPAMHVLACITEMVIHWGGSAAPLETPLSYAVRFAGARNPIRPRLTRALTEVKARPPKAAMEI